MQQHSAQLTVNNNQHPRWMDWINWGGRRLQTIGIQSVQLNEEALLATAQKQTQLTDWGDDSFRVGFKVLMTALNEEADLSLVGRLFLRADLSRLLVNRLQIQATLKRHPEILEVPIRRPLVITGLPRTGTTFLHRLLAQDPQFRWLRLWELLQPCPPPEKHMGEPDPRIQAAEKIARQYQTLSPVFSTTHHLQAQLPEEGNQLFEHAFSTLLYELRAHVPSYRDWLRTQTMRSQYHYYRQQLQLLSWHWPGRWLLKAPAHLTYLESLTQVFPDACIIQTHRDPCSVVPSICSLATLVRNIYTEQVDRSAIGKYWLEALSYGYEKGHQYRRQTPSTLICDVNYPDLIQDPIQTVHRIYDFFNDSLDSSTEQNMVNWLDANPQTKHGVHRYSIEQFGLTETEIRQAFPFL